MPERQLDLFSSLADRSAPAPKNAPAKPAPETPSGPEMVLPPAGTPPPDVSADVRAVLSESRPVRHVDAESRSGEGAPLPRTGIYQRPRRPAPPPPAPPPPPSRPAPKAPSTERISPVRWIRDWFSGVELDRRMVSLVVVLTVLVALVAFWTACPRDGGESLGTTVNLDEAQPSPGNSPVAAASVSPAPAAVAGAAPALAPAAVLSAPDWAVPGTVATRSGGAMLIRFSDPVFVSADKISVEGWAALKAAAAKLVSLKSGARVIVTGYTDNEPLSKPTPQFKSNADIAAARAKVAVDHLAQFSRAGKGLAFEARTGETAQAPYPNDTPQNRRLNRTVTLQVIPAP
jgi:flagellar motor protein MotB